MKSAPPNRDYKRIINHWGRSYALMILPIFSVSRPDPKGTKRIVFDWGKSLTHPNAKIGFAILRSPMGQWIERLIISDNVYMIERIKRCRSGRVAIWVCKTGRASDLDRQLIKKLMDSEFPNQSVSEG